MGDWKPGTVAKATVLGVEGVRVARYDAGWVRLDDPDIFYSDKNCDDMVTDVRPLVVLDPEHPSIRYFISKWVDVLPGEASGSETTVGAARYLSQQIEAQTKPSRIPEPGLWGVVEAWVPGIPTRRWVHHEEGRWVPDTGIPFKEWDDLIDPVLIREGVES